MTTNNGRVCNQCSSPLTGDQKNMRGTEQLSYEQCSSCQSPNFISGDASLLTPEAVRPTGSRFTSQNVKERASVLSFRGEDFPLTYRYYTDDTTGLEWVTPELGDTNLAQVYDAYRRKYGIPFPEDIKRIRSQYGLTALSMSKTLGFGVNMWRKYEEGEMPSKSNGRLIQSAANPAVFKNYLLAEPSVSEKQRKLALQMIDLLSRRQCSAALTPP